MKKEVVIIGGGACALTLGAELDPAQFTVSIYEKNTALGRKFLVAGDGGLNLTHSEDPSVFIERYTPASFLRKSFTMFSNAHFIKWLEKAGIKVVAGSSARIFPEKKWKPIDVLNVFIQKIKKNGTHLYFKHSWNGFVKDGRLLFKNKNGECSVKADYVIFCLGGASWPVTGSTGEWLDFFRNKNITVRPFYSSNCTYGINWPDELIDKIEGQALKNIRLTCGSATHEGEVIITRFGMEGSGIYPLSPQIRHFLMANGKATITFDFKPSLSVETIISKLDSKRGTKSYSEHVTRALNLSSVQIKLLKYFLQKQDFLAPTKLAARIKNFPLTITAAGPLSEAISSVGGIALEEIDENFELKKLPHHYCIGEMLDYDAPTGGYLLQSCFTMAKYLADRINDLDQRKGITR